MPANAVRRPVPAIVFLLILSLLAAIVWWRVLHRASDASTPKGTKSNCSTSAPSKPVTLPAPKAVSLTVLNGNGKSGLAATISNQLKARGFKIAKYGNDDPVTGVAEIRYTTKFATAATVVKAYLPGATLVPLDGTAAGVTVSLGAKFAALASAAAVKKALTTASQAPAPTC
ncbi:MAG: LytR C-terminal domain-containing protein [Jatrophihabitans sp.]